MSSENPKMVFSKTLCLFILAQVLAQDPIVNLPQGRIVGIKVYLENSVTPIEIFYGIPYAMAPIGRLRFSSPERHTGWRRTFFAHRLPPRCPQPGNNTSEYNEDCLFLNIWTSRRVDGKLQPVLVILYSDSWFYGGISLPCQELAAEGIIVVTVAYRLHILSFFTLKSVAARGNLALLDQYLALVWIRENIAAFGGDPASVTLAGHSAGANSVLHHILSPRPVGLFHRAIIMSPQETWRLMDKNYINKTSKVDKMWRKVASVLGCSSKSDREIMECMRAQAMSEIINVKLGDFLLDYLGPIPDDFLPVSEQYLPSPISKILSSTPMLSIHLDMLVGTTDLETLNFMDGRYTKLEGQNPEIIYEYATTQIIPKLLRAIALDHSESILMLTQAVAWEYWRSNFNNNTLRANKAVELVARMESSAKWSIGESALAAKLAQRMSRLYVYRYLEPSYVDLMGRHSNFSGAVHGADLIALLGDALMLQVARRRATDAERRISSLFRKNIVNFVKFGFPGSTGEWPRYDLKEPYVHEICLKDDTTCTSKKEGRNKEVEFWVHYLPLLASLIKNEQSEQLKSEKGENRLRGGVFAMCGITVILLLLLCASVILLYRRRTFRASISEDGTHL